MRVYGEAYLFINFWMDFLSLLLAARLKRARFRGLRAAVGAAAGAVAALLAWSVGGAMRGLPALFLSMLAITVISFGKSGFFLFPWVIASALLLCGLTDALLNNGASAPAALIVCGAAALGICRAQSSHPAPGNAGELTIYYRGRSARLPVLRDSGNLLTDGVTGLPVIVVSEGTVASLLPAGVRTGNLSTLPPGWRLLPIRTAAGNGTLMCFRADQLELRTKGKARRIDAAVAISGFSEKAALVPNDFFDERG